MTLIGFSGTGEDGRRRRHPRRARRWMPGGAGESGQAVLEYTGLLVTIAAVVAAMSLAFGALGLSGTLRSAVQRDLCQVGIESFGGSCTAPAASGRAANDSAAAAATAALQSVRSARLVDACAGGPNAGAAAAALAPDSAACRAALAGLTTRQTSILALLAATLQAGGDRATFDLLLQSYEAHPGWAVIALSPRAQAEQAAGNALLQKLQRDGGGLWDGLMGSLCGGYGLCLGGDTSSLAYRQALHASAQISAITTPVLILTGIGGALKDVAGPILRRALARAGLTVPDIAPAAGAAGGGDLLALPRGEPELTQSALDHIVARHFPASDAAAAGKFAPGTTGAEVKSMIRETVADGTLGPNTRGRPGNIYQMDFGQPIGVDRAGRATSRLRVVVGPNGQVITAFPY